MFDRILPIRSTSSLARLLTRCACFVMVRCFCYHMPVGLYAIVIEHGVGTHRFCSTLFSAFDIVSFPLGRTSVLGLELGTRLPFVVWITGEIVPLSSWVWLICLAFLVWHWFDHSDSGLTKQTFRLSIYWTPAGFEPQASWFRCQHLTKVTWIHNALCCRSNRLHIVHTEHIVLHEL